MFNKGAIGTIVPNPESSSTTRQGLAISNLSVGTYTFSCDKNIALYYARFANGYRIDSSANNIASSVNIVQIILTDDMDEIRFWCDTGSNWNSVNNPQLEVGSTATPYEPYFNGGTATCENLLSVSTYEDIQEVISGSVIRKIGIKVLDGTEDWKIWSGTYNYFRLDLTELFAKPSIAKGGLCSHFKSTSIGDSNNNQGYQLWIYSQTGKNTIGIRYDNVMPATSTNLPLFKQWLATQYANGTPVIIVYPLATPTTETATTQPMNLQKGTNIIEVTESSLDDLEIEATYYRTM